MENIPISGLFLTILRTKLFLSLIDRTSPSTISSESLIPAHNVQSQDSIESIPLGQLQPSHSDEATVDAVACHWQAVPATALSDSLKELGLYRSHRLYWAYNQRVRFCNPWVKQHDTPSYEPSIEVAVHAQKQCNSMITNTVTIYSTSSSIYSSSLSSPALRVFPSSLSYHLVILVHTVVKKINRGGVNFQRTWK